MRFLRSYNLGGVLLLASGLTLGLLISHLRQLRPQCSNASRCAPAAWWQQGAGGAWGAWDPSLPQQATPATVAHDEPLMVVPQTNCGDLNNVPNAAQGSPQPPSISSPQLASSGPSLEQYKQLQDGASGAVQLHSTALAENFLAAPWLLPPRTPALPWAGVHELDRLMALRSQPVGRYNQSVALLLFNRAFAVLAQNSIYSLVKLAGVRNYVVLTWTPADLATCADLNLPCASVEHLLVEPLLGQEDAQGSHLTWGNHDWLAVVWLKPAVVLHALQRGYAVMLADVDIAYTAKPLWDSYLAFIEEAGADGAFQYEAPVNTGQFVLLPTTASITFVQRWAEVAPEMFHKGMTTQNALTEMEGLTYFACPSLCRCYRAQRTLLQFGLREQVAVFRTYFASQTHFSQELCTVAKPSWHPFFDICDYKVAFLHVICADGAKSKEAAMRAARFWFMDSEEGCVAHTGSTSGVPACFPLQWRLPNTEAPHYGCPAPGLAWVRGDSPAAVGIIREQGLLSQAASELLEGDNGYGTNAAQMALAAGKPLAEQALAAYNDNNTWPKWCY